MSELFLIAMISGRPVAIPSDQVESVVDISEVTAVPRAASHIRGLAALRSRVVTVIDAVAALGLGKSVSATRAVITQVDNHYYAVLVEALDDVTPFDRQPLANGVTLDERWDAVAEGVVERDGEPILIVNAAALIPGPSEIAA
ncbi:chemotaxis protein CheW [Stakelama marina]|uniref:Chemotaxis protein CheW n=1 Tax=Stakelama marina TaxID=2826939 RepID=A0A8T4IA49_9SPHN|nr:chemotaxis protein CheW [Stakelama marina]MBR0551898.1 chemotaxis protein CheW [Stakelama marina]